MVQLKVIRPYRVKGEAACDRCDLTYSKRDYNILYKGKKLVYFDITIADRTRFICHDCFYKYLSKKSESLDYEDFYVEVKDANKTFIITVTNNIEGQDEDEPDFLL